MKADLRNYLIMAGVIGAGYALYNRYSTKTIPIQLTRKIAQEIKHQMMIVTINFAEGISKHAAGAKMGDPKITEYFIDELSKIYKQKEELIISKYGVPASVYKSSLDRYSSDRKIK